MDWQVIWENLIGTAGVIVGFWGCFVAARGLTTWRNQIIEGSKIELAREIVEQFYNMRDLIERMRQNLQSFSSYQEIMDHFEKPNWTAAQCSYMYPIFLLHNEMDQVIAFQKMNNKAKVYYSPKIEDCFVAFIRIIRLIKSSCIELCEETGRDDRCKRLSDDEFKELRSTIYNRENDEINTRIKEVISEVEDNLSPLYKPKEITWKQAEKKKDAK